MDSVKVGDILIDSEGRLAYVSEMRPEWSPIYQEYSNPKPFIRNANGAGFFTLSRYRKIELTCLEIERMLIEKFPNYKRIVSSGYVVNWLAIPYVFFEQVIKGETLSIKIDLVEANDSEVLLCAAFSDGIDIDLAIAWEIALSELWKLDRRSALALLKSKEFWTNKWVDGPKVFRHIVSHLCGLEHSFAWDLEWLEHLLADYSPKEQQSA